MREADFTALPGGIDCVYFLMWPGWKDELRSNRWHYATRWSQVAPVVLVQPDLPPSETREGVFEPEPRIRNCRILHIEAESRRQISDDSFNNSSLLILNQVAQLRTDMQAHGYSRPLLWLYNPKLVALYCASPAVARVVHSTENYFEFPSLPDAFLEQLKLCLRLSDLTVAVSSGVARGISAHVPEARVTMVSNGCDYGSYAAGRPDRKLMELRQGYSKLAIYAGNINLRMDFALLLRCAERFADTLFVLAGPVTGNDVSNPLELGDQALWDRLLQLPNCRHLGAVDPDRLPDLYAAADIGIIPYKDLLVIRESGFALKALEMLASGLPVVSSLMRPMTGLTEGLAVVDNAADFLETLGTLCRSALSDQARAQMAAFCRENDYGQKFRQVLGSLTQTLAPDAAPASHMGPFIDEFRRHLILVEEAKRSLIAHTQWLRAAYDQDVQRLQEVYRQDVERLQAIYGKEVERLQAIYGKEVERLRSEYGEGFQRRDGEIERLHTVYGEEVLQRNIEIERLHKVYLEAIQQRDIGLERLTAELRYFRRFRTAARRIPEVEGFLSAVRFVRRTVC